VADVIERLEPWGVDVSSGVERAPGRKDPIKVRRFIEAARAAEPAEYEGETDRPYDWQEELFR
jgi:phosphoribosylanthranilate isomerase